MFKEDCRIEVFADEQRRRSAENQRNAQTDSTTLSERSVIDIDNSTTEDLAKEIFFSAIKNFGKPHIGKDVGSSRLVTSSNKNKHGVYYSTAIFASSAPKA